MLIPASNYHLEYGLMVHDGGITERQRRSDLWSRLLAGGDPDSVPAARVRELASMVVRKVPG
jgi:hypothetical protein